MAMSAWAKVSRRVVVALAISTGGGVLLMHGWTDRSALFLRTTIVGLVATIAFALFEVWPRMLPRWFQRWVLQVVAVGVSVPITTLLMYPSPRPRVRGRSGKTRIG